MVLRRRVTIFWQDVAMCAWSTDTDAAVTIWFFGGNLL
jgi:hypothetical protein